MKIGYARVSTDDQNLDLQRDALAKAGCERVFTDTASGAKADRPGLGQALSFARTGDVLVVWRLDRLGRSLKELVALVDRLGEAGVGLESVTERIDTTTASGELVFHIFGSIAQFERRLMIERTKAGLLSARARGRQGGRPGIKSETIQAIKSLSLTERTPAEICKVLRISRSTFYKYSPREVDVDLLDQSGMTDSHVERFKRNGFERVSDLDGMDRLEILRLPNVNNRMIDALELARDRVRAQKRQRPA